MRSAAPPPALPLALALAMAITGSTILAHQGKHQPPVVFPSALVRVDAIVERDYSSDLPLPALSKDDFVVLVDGVPRPLAWCSADPVPLSLVLLVDVSDSLTAASSPKEFRLAMDDLIQTGLKPTDRARFGAIADTLYWTSPLSDVRTVLSTGASDVLAMGALHGQGPTPVWDALDTAVRSLSGESNTRRRAVVVISDGQATGNLRGSEEVARDAALAGVIVSTVTERFLSSVVTLGPGADQTKAMRRVAEISGGTAVIDGFAPAPRDPQKYLRVIMDALHHAYTLGINPVGGDGPSHTLQVTVKRTGLVARARTVYRDATAKTTLFTAVALPADASNIRR